MESAPIKTLFVSVIVFAILLPYFAFFSVSLVNAQELGGSVLDLPPELDLGNSSKESLIELFPEIQRLDQQNSEAKPNETIAGPVLDPLEKSVPGCDIKSWLDPSTAPLCAIYAAVRGIARLLGWTILPLASAFFEKLVDINLDNGETALFASAFVDIGWGISRDVANMFFIFFVLWMALATIFQFESYSAKRLLPKLIVVALLVNFSLPIGTFFIRTTNAIAQVFHQAAKGNSSLTAQIMNVAAIHRAYTSLNPDEKTTTAIKANPELNAVCNPSTTKRITDSILNSLLGTNFGNANKQASPGQIAHARYVLQLTDETAANLTTQAAICSVYNMKRGDTPGELVTMALMASIWQIIISLIASFVFFAGGIFLLVRSISLAVLLVFGPLAFLFMILPATQEHWNKWWSKLTQWSFFAPAFMFMIMLSIRSASSLFNVYIARQVGPLTMNDSIGLGVQFLMVSGLLIASLFVAQSMGIAMSGTVVGWGRSMARGAGRYAKGKGIQYAKIGAGGIAGGIQSNALLQRTLSAIPLMGGTIARGLGATRAMGEAAEKQRQRQKFGFAEKLSDEGRANYIASEKPTNARVLLEKMDAEDRRNTINALSADGQVDLRRKLETVRAGHLVDEATNSPEVLARFNANINKLTGEKYIQAVSQFAHDRFKGKNAANIAPEFLQSQFAREYLKTATSEEIESIGKKSRKHAETLGDALADIQNEMSQKIDEMNRGYLASIESFAVRPPESEIRATMGHNAQTIQNGYLGADAQQFLGTSPGLRLLTGEKLISEEGGRGGKRSEKALLKLLKKEAPHLFENKPSNP